jgi:hypothetical protein
MPHSQVHYLIADTSDEVLLDVIPTTGNDMYPEGFPGYVGVSSDNLASDAFTPNFLCSTVATDTPAGNIDYEIGGNSGQVNRNSYAIGGPVEPNLVENFELTGAVIRPGRRPEYSLPGEVGSYDHSAYTTMQVVQQTGNDAYTTATLLSLLSGDMNG